MEFKAGQKVLLIDNSSMRALLGATAIVGGVHKELISVRWLTDSKGQMDGGYYPWHFKLLSEKGKQLEFEFMTQ